jgi:dipeptide transport system ATP-binding protein
MTAVLKTQNLTRYYHVSRGAFRGRVTLKALDGVSFTLNQGKTLAVVGRLRDR